MIDLSRRLALKLFGAGTISALAPAAISAAPQDVQGLSPSRDLLALRDKMQSVIDSINPEEVFAREQYRELFSTMRVHHDPCATCDAVLEDGQRWTHVNYSHDGAPSFVYCIKHEEIGLGYALALGTPDAELRPTALGLIKAFKEYREINAAELFNAPLTYRSDIVGDGVSMCSDRHPCDGATWSNVLPSYAPLTTRSLRTALRHIRTQFVDDQNLRIMARGKKLVVPVALMDAAEKATKRMPPEERIDWMVWDYLEDDRAWFVLTDVDGLAHSERRPFQIKLEIDTKANNVTVIGSEKRGFGYHDPRAVLGVIPPRESQGI